jgi:hypothetical protein
MHNYNFAIKDAKDIVELIIVDEVKPQPSVDEVEPPSPSSAILPAQRTRKDLPL